MSGSRSRLTDLPGEYPFGVLVLSLLVIIIGAPLTSGLGREVSVMHGAGSIAPLVLVLTLASGFAIWKTSGNRAAFAVLGGLVLISLYLSTVFRHHALTAVHLVGQILFLLYVIAVVTRAVFSAPLVDGNILFGAASIYLLIGVLAGFVFSLVELIVPGSFLVVPAGGPTAGSVIKPDAGWLIYFSFTTLTTVGFGDIIPAGEISRSLAVLEAVVGQILLVVMMARLVGLHVAQVSSGRHHTPVVFETAEHPAGHKKDA
ncbi:MAG: potassium channel family protein [Terrimicrobiaceae bacterium]